MRRAHRGRWAVALLGFAVATEEASAQRTTAVWMDLVQMPVAVARLEMAGIPLADLRLLVPALNVGSVTPTYFIETVRGIPLLAYRDDRWDRGEGEGTGGYVAVLHRRGLRGPALADAIHAELRRRGVPAGPKDRTARSHQVLHRDYLPGVILERDGRGDDRGRARFEGRGPSGREPPGAGRDRVRLEERGSSGRASRRPQLEQRRGGRGNGAVERPGKAPEAPAARPTPGKRGKGGAAGPSRPRPGGPEMKGGAGGKPSSGKPRGGGRGSSGVGLVTAQGRR